MHNSFFCHLNIDGDTVEQIGPINYLMLQRKSDDEIVFLHPAIGLCIQA